MDQGESQSFAEVLSTLLLGIIAGVLTTGFSEFVKTEYEEQKSQKIILLHEVRQSVSCNPAAWSDLKQLSVSPNMCWQTGFKLSRRGSVQPIQTLTVEARAVDS